MTEDELQELLADSPTLYHMAETGSWPSVRKFGLLSTTALLDLFGVTAAERHAIESQRRPENVRIQNKEIGTAVVRDQKPMDDAGLRRCLQDDLTPEAWYRLLNCRVFFWLTQDRLHRLLTAQAYADLEHDVLEIEAAPLVEAYRDEITLSPMNSGCTKPFPHARGVATFRTIDDYPYQHWKQRRKKGERVVELAVNEGVPDIDRYVRRVVAMKGTSILRTIWTRD